MKNKAIVQKGFLIVWLSCFCTHFNLAQTRLQVRNERERALQMAKSDLEKGLEYTIGVLRMAIRAQYPGHDKDGVVLSQDIKQLVNEIKNRDLNRINTAESLRIDAEKAKEEALANEQEAIRQKRSADSLRILSTAQVLAGKSLQVNIDTTLKALLALQAYQYHKKSSGEKYDNIIYRSLLEALKTVKGSRFNRLESHEGAVKGFHFAKSSPWLYTICSNGNLCQWKKEEEQYVAQAERARTSTHKVRNMASRRGDRWIFVMNSEEPFAELVDLDAPKIKSHPVKDIKNPIEAICSNLQREGFLFKTKDGPIHYLDPEDLSTEDFYSHKGPIDALALHEDQLVIATQDGSLLLVNLSTGARQNLLDGYNFSKLAIDQEGKYLVAGTETGEIFIWDLLQKTRLTEGPLGKHAVAISDIAFNKAGDLMAVSSRGGTTHLWPIVEDNLERRLPIILQSGQNRVSALAFDEASNFLLIGERRAISFWPLDLQGLAKELCKHIVRDHLSEKEWRKYIGVDEPYKSDSLCDN